MKYLKNIGVCTDRFLIPLRSIRNDSAFGENRGERCGLKPAPLTSTIKTNAVIPSDSEESLATKYELARDSSLRCAPFRMTVLFGWACAILILGSAPLLSFPQASVDTLKPPHCRFNRHLPKTPHHCSARKAGRFLHKTIP